MQRTQGTFELCHRRVRLELRERFFSQRVLALPRLPREWAQPQVLPELQERLDNAPRGAQGGIVGVSVQGQRLDWIGLDWIGLDWIGLDWIGLDWIGLDAPVIPSSSGYSMVLFCLHHSTGCGHTLSPGVAVECIFPGTKKPL
ncbi:hypothetical protein DUI87_14588 [Hirundo rustica rustica]|uniref:Uncharacterized protein n=1 Tax=Hirundo rustica rustica TaxID=333673 RepID=A0A3M0K569_HIRRU|nr:hypothetical protein DUI87_14588 [Hirundo rustica rustica]